MGKDPNEERESKPSRQRRRKPASFAHYDEADPTKLKRAIAAAAATGGALRFGYSRDGGAFAIGVYGDGDPYTDFVSSREDINDSLDYYVDLFDSGMDDTEASGMTPKKPPEPRKKPM